MEPSRSSRPEGLTMLGGEPAARVPRPCSTPGCGTVLQVRASSTVAPLCAPCREAEDRAWQKAETERTRAELATRLPRVLKGRGMRKDHLAAHLNQVDASLMALVQGPLNLLMSDLEAPSSGWGMLGGTGTGKSHLAAAVVKAWTWKAANHRLDAFGVLGGVWPLWASWAETLDDLRGLMREKGTGYGDLMDDLRDCPLLVLDDLGAERAQPAEGSWAVERLYDVLESRYSSGRATIWTSNLTMEDLTARYEKRIVSRLVGLARPITLPSSLKDRRLSGR